MMCTRTYTENLIRNRYLIGAMLENDTEMEQIFRHWINKDYDKIKEIRNKPQKKITDIYNFKANTNK